MQEHGQEILSAWEDRKATTLSQAVEAWGEAFVDVARLQRWEEWAIGTDRTAEMALGHKLIKGIPFLGER